MWPRTYIYIFNLNRLVGFKANYYFVLLTEMSLAFVYLIWEIFYFTIFLVANVSMSCQSDDCEFDADFWVRVTETTKSSASAINCWFVLLKINFYLKYKADDLAKIEFLIPWRNWFGCRLFHHILSILLRLWVRNLFPLS